ncbi:MAG: diaminopimelate epimerase [Acidimicrobiales bacterium]
MLLRLTKHHGAGNDFLVLVDIDAQEPIDGRIASWLCDRHRGVGADGVIRLTGRSAPGPAFEMELFNADGTVAETSGNGIRCAAQALAGAGLIGPGPELLQTAGGPARIWVNQHDDRSAVVTVEIGPVVLGDGEAAGEGFARGLRIGVGNPHLVLLPSTGGSRNGTGGAGLAGIDLLAVGRRLDAATPGGVNVEVVLPTPGRRDEILMRVFERGVGETLACGSGSVAAAAAARHWGLTGDRVTVVNPGGPLEVDLGPAGPVGRAGMACLSGPAERVCSIEVDITWQR